MVPKSGNDLGCSRCSIIRVYPHQISYDFLTQFYQHSPSRRISISSPSSPILIWLEPRNNSKHWLKPSEGASSRLSSCVILAGKYSRFRAHLASSKAPNFRSTNQWPLSNRMIPFSTEPCNFRDDFILEKQLKLEVWNSSKPSNGGIQTSQGIWQYLGMYRGDWMSHIKEWSNNESIARIYGDFEWLTLTGPMF